MVGDSQLNSPETRPAAENALRKSEERLRLFLAASSTLVYRMNADWTRMENLVGKELLADTPEPITNWVDKYIFPEDQPLVLQTIQIAIDNKCIFELEHRVRLGDGSVGWIHSRAIPLLNDRGEILEWFGAGTDITQEHEAKEALQKSEEKFRTLFDSIDEGFCVFDMIFDSDDIPVDYRFVEYNPAFERHSGLTGAIGRTVREFLPDQDRHWFETYGRVAMTGEPARVTRYGEALKRWIEVYAFRLGEPQQRRIAAIFSDITDRKEAELALQASEERQAILLKLSDMLRPLDHPDTVKKAASKILGEHLGVNRAFYGEVQDDSWMVCCEYVHNVPALTHGRYAATTYGGWMMDTFRQGGILQFSNSQTDPRFSPSESAALAELQVIGSLGIGLIKKDNLEAILAVHSATPRKWTTSEIELVRLVAERTYAAVERARAEEALRKKENRMRRQKEAFQLVINDAAIDDSLNTIAGMVVDETEGKARTAFYIADPDRKSLHSVFGAGNMPVSYLQEIDGFPIGENSIACGLAVPTGKPVLITDILQEDLTPSWRYIAEKYDLRGCWSFPIKTRDNQTIGTFAMYFKTPRTASKEDLELAEIVTQTAAIIISNDTDLWERRRAENALRQSEQQLRALLKQRDEFIGIASHELKTPVTSIKAYAEIVQRRLDQLGSKDDSDMILKLNVQINRLTKLINTLLDTTRISEGQLTLHEEQLDINELLLERIGEIKRTSNHVFDLQLLETPSILADRERIGQVVTNLLSNAIKYSPEKTTITVSSKPIPNGVVVSILDQGYGIPEQDIKKIFDKFFRVTAQKMGTFPGMGLGLYITAEIIHKHNGTLSVQSTEDKGSLFTFTLPYNRQA